MNREMKLKMKRYPISPYVSKRRVLARHVGNETGNERGHAILEPRMILEFEALGTSFATSALLFSVSVYLSICMLI